MDILDSQLGSNIVDDIFIEICKYLKFKQLLELQLLSKYNGKIIRKTKWIHNGAILNNTSAIQKKIIYLVTNFNFMCYDLTFYKQRVPKACIKILTDAGVIALKLRFTCLLLQQMDYSSIICY